MTTESDDDKCGLCGQSFQWHQEHRPAHTFVVPGTAGGLAQLGASNRERGMFPNRQGQQRSNVKVLPGLPSDPALRVLLLRKGVITQDELNEVEREIREAKESGSIVVVMPNSQGTGGGGGSDPESGSRTSA